MKKTLHVSSMLVFSTIIQVTHVLHVKERGGFERCKVVKYIEKRAPSMMIFLLFYYAKDPNHMNEWKTMIDMLILVGNFLYTVCFWKTL